MVWSLALCPDDAKPRSGVCYCVEFAMRSSRRVHVLHVHPYTKASITSALTVGFFDGERHFRKRSCAGSGDRSRCYDVVICHLEETSHGGAQTVGRGSSFLFKEMHTLE